MVVTVGIVWLCEGFRKYLKQTTAKRKPVIKQVAQQEQQCEVEGEQQKELHIKAPANFKKRREVTFSRFFFVLLTIQCGREGLMDKMVDKKGEG